MVFNGNEAYRTTLLVTCGSVYTTQNLIFKSLATFSQILQGLEGSKIINFLMFLKNMGTHRREKPY